jgi:hypothetical protein
MPETSAKEAHMNLDMDKETWATEAKAYTVGDFCVSLAQHMVGGRTNGHSYTKGDISHPDLEAAIEVKGNDNTRSFYIRLHQLSGYITKPRQLYTHSMYFLFGYRNRTIIHPGRRESLLKRRNNVWEICDLMADRLECLFIIDGEALDVLSRYPRPRYDTGRPFPRVVETLHNARLVPTLTVSRTFLKWAVGELQGRKYPCRLSPVKYAALQERHSYHLLDEFVVDFDVYYILRPALLKRVRKFLAQKAQPDFR